MLSKRLIVILAVAATFCGCVSAPLEGRKPDGTTVSLKYYDGGSNLDDLVVLDGTMYPGKSIYQMDDPLGDIGFRFTSGERVVAECSTQGVNMLGDPECHKYTVFLSQFEAIPEGTVFDRPQIF